MLSKEEKRDLRSRLFRHLDGIVTAPTVVALRDHGVLDAFESANTIDVDSLAAEKNANAGYLNVGLRVLASQGWLTQTIDNSNNRVSYSATESFSLMRQASHLYDEAVSVAKYSANYHPRNFEREPFYRMERAVTLLNQEFGDGDDADSAESMVRHQILRHAEGLLLGPTIVHLGMTGMFHKYFMDASFRPDEFHEDAESFGKLLRIFADRGWFVETNGTFQFTEVGLFYARRASAYGVTVSYLPSLRHLDHLIFGDPDYLRVAEGEKERHVDREMNVWGSGGAHAAYFKAIDDIIIELFNRPISEQPRGILDMGCGNGAFLIHLFDVIETQTRRGEMLEDYPLFLVGVDFNEAALRVTRSNLTQAEVWAKVIWGDIGNPDQLAEDLHRDYGIALRDLLNVRTFLDHNRMWVEPHSEPARTSPSTGAYASRGARLSNTDVETSLSEHLERWKPFVDRFGLLMIELHTVPPALTAANLGRTPATAYDATHGYSDQYIMEVDVFRHVAGQSGFKIHETFARRYPDSDLATVTLNLLTVQDN
ncbi:MAG: class I SAM-dependent methyltransferase [Rhodothermales bacterium]|nr:class I SAM-dependent methyltransferase [Rhodothermales bacterium]